MVELLQPCWQLLIKMASNSVFVYKPPNLYDVLLVVNTKSKSFVSFFFIYTFSHNKSKFYFHNEALSSIALASSKQRFRRNTVNVVLDLINFFNYCLVNLA